MRSGWRTESLGAVCQFLNRGISPAYLDLGGVSVLNQKCVRDHTVNFDLGRRHNTNAKNVAPDKFVRAGDVLVNSTGTGTLGRVAQVRGEPSEPTTVDSHVTIVRAVDDLFYPEFFGYALVAIEEQIQEGGEGCGGQTELARSKLANDYRISFPTDRDIQKRIVAILDEAFGGIATAKANAEKNLQNACAIFDNYLQSIFSQQGDGWGEKRLVEISKEFGRGKSRHRPRNAPKLYGGPYPLIQTGDVSNADHWLINHSQTYSELGLAQSKIWRSGTVCIAIVGANVGETAILGFDACFPDSVIGISVDERVANNEYVEYLLQSFKAFLKEKGKGTARDNINMGTFENQKFPFPSLKSQTEIVATLNALREETQRLESIYQQKLTSFDELKKSLLSRAFAGQL